MVERVGILSAVCSVGSLAGSDLMYRGELAVKMSSSRWHSAQLGLVKLLRTTSRDPKYQANVGAYVCLVALDPGGLRNSAWYDNAMLQLGILFVVRGAPCVEV